MVNRDALETEVLYNAQNNSLYTYYFCSKEQKNMSV